MSTLTVSEIWRYPIKSVGGERVSMATVTELGVLGDRGWGIRELDGNTVLTARRAPELLFANASLDGADVRIELPDGSVGSSADDDIDARLSDWLGRPVRLDAAGAEGGTYEVPLDFEADENWVSWQGPANAWHDSGKSRISLVSRASLRDWDARRFRTNVILDGDGEDELVGHTARPDDDIDTRLSDWLGRPVRLEAAGDEGGTYEVPLDFEADENWVSWQGPANAWHDSGKSRISLVSRASLRDWDARRFRTNVILDGDGEDKLVGQTALLGDDIVLDVRKRIDRCVIVTRPQPGLDRDLDVLRTINAELESCLTIGALVTTGGTLGQGDQLRPA